MNVSSISASDLAQRTRDFNSLQNALQSGNISNAQGAFAAFMQDVQKTSNADKLFAPGSQAGKDLERLEGALKSADLSGAQKAFATLQQDIQPTPRPTTHVHNGARPARTLLNIHA